MRTADFWRCVFAAVVAWVCRVDSAHAQKPRELRFEMLFREVGRVVLEEPDSAPITEIKALARFPDGRFLIADGRGAQLRVHAPDGRLLSLYDRQGMGPGELKQPIDVAIDPAGRVYVADTRGPVVQRWGATMAYDTAFGVRDGDIAYQVEVVDGRVLLGIRHASGAYYVWLSEDGEVQGTFHEWPEVILKEPYWRSVAVDRGAVCGNNVLVATSMVYPVRVYDRQGRYVGDFGKPPASWKPAPRLAAGELAGPAQMKKLADWLARFTVIDGVECYRGEVVLIAHGRFASSASVHHVGDLFQVTQYAVDIYRGVNGAAKVVEDLALPGRLLAVDDRIYVLLAVPPDPWAIGIYELDFGATATRMR